MFDQILRLFYYYKERQNIFMQLGILLLFIIILAIFVKLMLIDTGVIVITDTSLPPVINNDEDRPKVIEAPSPKTQKNILYDTPVVVVTGAICLAGLIVYYIVKICTGGGGN